MSRDVSLAPRGKRQRRSPDPGIEYLPIVPPGPGEAREIVPGLLWVRVPLPMELSHINLWLLDGGTDWTLVDTGLAAAVCRDVWMSLERSVLRGRRLDRIFLTHDHPDHMGLARWLSDRHGAEVLISADAFRSVNAFVDADRAEISARITGFLHAQGIDVEGLDAANLRGDHFDWYERTAWSVVIKGEATIVHERDDLIDLFEVDVLPWHADPKPYFVRLLPDSITGRRFRVSPSRHP